VSASERANGTSHRMDDPAPPDATARGGLDQPTSEPFDLTETQNAILELEESRW
jgi:hypothetical protein